MKMIQFETTANIPVWINPGVDTGIPTPGKGVGREGWWTTPPGPCACHSPHFQVAHVAPCCDADTAEATGMSLTYVCDITAGRRTLKRNPELRKKIAVALNVPQHWIEHAEPVAS